MSTFMRPWCTSRKIGALGTTSPSSIKQVLLSLASNIIARTYETEEQQQNKAP